MMIHFVKNVSPKQSRKRSRKSNLCSRALEKAGDGDWAEEGAGTVLPAQRRRDSPQPDYAATPALWACWSAWYELRTMAPTAACTKPIL